AVRDLRDLRGVAYVLGAREAQQLPARSASEGTADSPSLALRAGEYITLPTYEQVKSDKLAFVEATRVIHVNTNPFNAKTLVQFHDREAVVVTPPSLPLSREEMDAVYDLPYTRRPH